MKVFEFDKIPIVEIVNEILLDGVKRGASDIHFDPSKESITVRMRVDGVLHDYTVVPLEFKRNIISRVKMIASMNIMETRLPQDGAIKSKIGEKMLDLRVSSLPTNCGEKVVLRILDYSKSLQGLETLGFSNENLNKIFKMVAVPNGIVLVTGATGSGKSTTVYSILQKLNTREVNIITVEDPVEMDVEGLNQVQAQQEIGLDFATVLRSILRQDPDIIMIGEIRDTETAQIAVRSSITGHKVVSTIHTNSALNTIERLLDMGVERYLIGTSLSGIISQKLARKLCVNCRIERDATDYEKKLIKEVLHKDIEKVYDANPDGCDQCTHGFKNRVAIAEVLFINDDVRTGITNNANKEEMRKLVYGHGNTHTLLQDGLDKVVSGETCFDEILRLSDLENDLAITKELEAEGLNDFSMSEQFQAGDLESLIKPMAADATPAPAEVPAAAPVLQEQPAVATTAPVQAEVPSAPTDIAMPIEALTTVQDTVTTTTNASITPVETPVLDTMVQVPTDQIQTVSPMPAEVPVQEIAEVQQNGTVVTESISNTNSVDEVFATVTTTPIPAEPVATIEQPVVAQAPQTAVVEYVQPVEPLPEMPAVQAPVQPEAPATPVQEPAVNANNNADEFMIFDIQEEPKPEALETIELSAVIPPNNTAAAVNLNTGETPKTIEMFQ